MKHSRGKQGVREYSRSFLRETNRKRYPDAEQEYRFELCEREPAREHREKTEVSEETLIMEFLELDENEDARSFL